MTKLCPRGKAAAKKNLRCTLRPMLTPMLLKVCAGKIKDPGGVRKR